MLFFSQGLERIWQMIRNSRFASEGRSERCNPFWEARLFSTSKEIRISLLKIGDCRGFSFVCRGRGLVPTKIPVQVTLFWTFLEVQDMLAMSPSGYQSTRWPWWRSLIVDLQTPQRSEGIKWWSRNLSCCRAVKPPVKLIG